MRIGELAAKAGVGIQTIRYYERRGLLKETQRRPSGYREYSSAVVQRVRFIRRAQELGFALDEVAELLALRDGQSQPGAGACDIALAKVEDIERRIRQLSAMRAALGTLLEACASSKGSPTCAILEALDDAADAPTRHQSPGSNNLIGRLRR